MNTLKMWIMDKVNCKSYFCVYFSLFFCRQESMGRLFDWPFHYVNTETESQKGRALPLCVWMHHSASGSSLEIPSLWLTHKTMVQLFCGVSYPVDVFRYLKFDIGMVNIFPAQIIWHPSTLWVWRHVYWHVIQYVSMQLECNIVECLYLYENVKVHIRSVANQLHLVTHGNRLQSHSQMI